MASPSPLALSVPVLLDKERTMVVDWNAMYRIEEALTRRRGGSWVSMQNLGDLSKVAVADMRTIVWGSLLYGDPEVTEDQVGKMVHMGNQEYVCEKLAEAMGADDKTKKDPAQPTTPSDNGSQSLPETDG